MVFKTYFNIFVLQIILINGPTYMHRVMSIFSYIFDVNIGRRRLLLNMLK